MEEAKSQSGGRSSPLGVRSLHRRSLLLRAPAERPSVFSRHLMIFFFSFFFSYLCISFFEPTDVRKKGGRKGSELESVCLKARSVYKSKQKKKEKKLHMEKCIRCIFIFREAKRSRFLNACRTVIQICQDQRDPTDCPGALT